MFRTAFMHATHIVLAGANASRNDRLAMNDHARCGYSKTTHEGGNCEQKQA